MRWGELIGLQRKNLDVANRRVRVVDQLVRTADGKFHRMEPKTTASVRSITISGITADVLADHLTRFAGSGPDGLVFPNTAGNPLAESSFYIHHYKKAMGVRAQAAVSRPAAHVGGVGHRRGSAPEGDPGADGALVDRRHARPVRAPPSEP